MACKWCCSNLCRGRARGLHYMRISKLTPWTSHSQPEESYLIRANEPSITNSKVREIEFLYWMRFDCEFTSSLEWIVHWDNAWSTVLRPNKCFFHKIWLNKFWTNYCDLSTVMAWAQNCLSIHRACEPVQTRRKRRFR